MTISKVERRMLWGFPLVGLALASILFVVMVSTGEDLSENRMWMMLILWPTSPLVMSAEAGGGSAGVFLAFLISASANALVFGLIGGVVVLVYRRFARKLR